MMAMRIHSSPFNKRYLGDDKNMVVHDLENENPMPNACQIDEIIRKGNAIVFMRDTLEDANDEGYDNCKSCIGY